MMYSLYNVIIYDGKNAYVLKFILKSDETQAMYDLKKYWFETGYDGEILKIDKLHSESLTGIISYAEIEEYKIVYKRFEEMYF